MPFVEAFVESVFVKPFLNAFQTEYEVSPGDEE